MTEDALVLLLLSFAGVTTTVVLAAFPVRWRRR